VYGIVNQSGGGIGVETSPATGTTFHIYIPRYEGASRPLRLVPSNRRITPIGAETVLLVEDDEDVGTVLRRILTRLGYHVITARDGQEAIDLSTKHDRPIHLLLTDIVMPKMSGGELLRELSRTRPGVKVLYVSGHTQEYSVRELDIDPEAAFLQKPFSPDLLARRVREVLDAS
jgi:DNA-binding NtrC family response regulator